MCHPFHHVITGTEVNDCEAHPLAHHPPSSEVPSAIRNRRLWLQSIIAGGAAVISMLKGGEAVAMQGTINPPPGTVTTQALGEEGGVYRTPRQSQVTTRALGEEGSVYRPPTSPPMTTQALGEEGGTRLPPERVTTFAMGEEGSGHYLPPRTPTPPRFQIPPRYPYPSGPVTTYAMGEEGAGHWRFP
jgi:hypothetical protein